MDSRLDFLRERVSALSKGILSMADRPRLNQPAFSAKHPSQHPAPAAEHEHGKKVPGHLIHAMVGNQ